MRGFTEATAAAGRKNGLTKYVQRDGERAEMGVAELSKQMCTHACGLCIHITHEEGLHAWYCFLLHTQSSVNEESYDALLETSRQRS